MQVYSGDDLNTGNHNYPGGLRPRDADPGRRRPTPRGWGWTLPEPERRLRGSATALLGLIRRPASAPASRSAPTSAARTPRSSAASPRSRWRAPTGSTNTGKAAGAAALVISAPRKDQGRSVADARRDAHHPRADRRGRPAAATRIGAGTPDPAQEGCDTPLRLRAASTSARRSASPRTGTIPPEASIALARLVRAADRRPRSRSRARASVAARRRRRLHAGSSSGASARRRRRRWNEVASGAATLAGHRLRHDRPRRGARGARAAAPPTGRPGRPGLRSAHAPTRYEGQFTVRLIGQSADGVRDAGHRPPRVHRVRRSDPAPRLPEAPRHRRRGAAALRATSTATTTRSSSLPTEDGVVHAYRRDGGELPGWPVKTDADGAGRQPRDSPGVAAVAADAPALEPPRAPTIVDLDGDGIAEVVTTAGEHIYAWDADGERRSRLPGADQPGLLQLRPGPAEQAARAPQVRLPRPPRRLRGSTVPTAAAVDRRPRRSTGTSTRLPTATATPSPASRSDLVDPGVAAASRMYAESINNPADRRPRRRRPRRHRRRDQRGLRRRATRGDGDLDGGFADATRRSAATRLGGASRLYAVDGATGAFLAGWPIKLAGAIQDTLPLIGPGHDAAHRQGRRRHAGDRRLDHRLGEHRASTAPTARTCAPCSRRPSEPASDASERTGPRQPLRVRRRRRRRRAPGCPTSSSTRSTLGQVANLAAGRPERPLQPPDRRLERVDRSAAAGLPGDHRRLPVPVLARRSPRSTPGAPATRCSPAPASVCCTPTTASRACDAPGFPKVTGGWLFAPARRSPTTGASPRSRARATCSSGTRPAPACQPSRTWPTFRHDEQGSGNYDTDGTPPGGVTDLERPDQRCQPRRALPLTRRRPLLRNRDRVRRPARGRRPDRDRRARRGWHDRQPRHRPAGVAER